MNPIPASRSLPQVLTPAHARHGAANRATVVSRCIASVLAAATTVASALPGTFEIEQIYSDAAAAVQFVVIRDGGRNNCDSGEEFWAGESLISSGGPNPSQAFVFPSNLPTCATSGRRILVATQAFAGLGVITPDYVIPNGFIRIPSGRLDFAGVSTVLYTALPNDGVSAVLANGTPVPNLATNLAGQSASVSGAPTFAINFGIGGTWHNPATPGQGFLLEVVPALNSVVLGWFTWSDTSGDHFWLSGIGPIAGDSATVELIRSGNGRFNDPAPVNDAPAGTATFRFSDCSHGTVTFQRSDTGESGTVPIERLTPVPPACSESAKQ